MKYIDIHCHLDREDYGDDFENILQRMKENGVGAITIGADLETSKRAVEIAEANENIWACVGVHPDYFSSEVRGIDLYLENLIKHPKVVGVGECGLDYFGDKNEELKNIQKEFFKIQIEIALKYNKPLMLHIRGSERKNFDAYFDTIKILNEYKKDFGEKLRGNVHFFSGNTESIKEFLELGFSMSFTGVITFTNDYDELIKFLPQDKIMSETDSPWVAPVPYRGKRNEPIFVIEVIKKMAEIRNENEFELNMAIINNAKTLFGLNDTI